MEKPENVKVIEWEDYEQELARLWSLSSALKDAKENKLSLHHKLEPLIQVKTESLSQLNELDEMRQKLEKRKLAMGNMIMRLKVGEEDAKKQKDQLITDVSSLLVDATSLSSSRKQLQEASQLVAGEQGNLCLKKLQEILRTRQQYMVSQVSYLYPVKALIGPAQDLELESYPSTSRSGNSHEPKLVNQEILTVLGLQLSILTFKKMSFFTDKKEVQMSATALGYVAHVISLIASYLLVPLRYPLRLGGSRSYVNDYAPSIESTSSDSQSTISLTTNTKPVEFPLFLEGQDTTRAAYAVFLLNKDLEQLLNFVGVNSLGPSQVLGNLKELLRTILSPEYVDT